MSPHLRLCRRRIRRLRVSSGTQLVRAVTTTLLKMAAAWAIVVLLGIATSMFIPQLVRIPVEIRVACAALVVLAVILTWRMLRERRTALAEIGQLRAALLAIRPLTTAERQAGLPDARLQHLRDHAATLRAHPARWWDDVEDSLVLYRWADGEAGWFVDRRADEILPVESVVLPSYHASLHAAVPAVLTALGLLATFTAILLALAGVSYDGRPGAPVHGIEGLINGLSGKFLSSILALLLSVIFTFIEKLACERSFRQHHLELIETFRRRIPTLRPLQVLLDIRESVDHTQTQPVGWRQSAG